VSPGGTVTGFPPGTVTGTIFAADATAATAQNDLTTAYNFAAAESGATLLAAELGGTTVTPGVYNFGSSAQITGTVTLSGAGVYVFQIPSTLTTASSSQVSLTGGAMADKVFWQVGSSATLGTGSRFIGTILAQASITVTTGAFLNGRALARVGAVTLDDNSVISPAGPPPPRLPPGRPLRLR
jgi:type VI secretion system secreted protein VgrG